MAFRGFDKSAPGFFHELSIEMNREWFDANKARYQEQWVEPMTELLGEVRAKLAKTYAPTKLGEPKLFRIYRDVRFSKDKTPYKTHISGHIPVGGSAKKPVDGGATALYFEFGLEDDWAGAGTYFFDAKQLPRFRKRVAADATGTPLVALVEKLRKGGYTVAGHGDFKRVPKPFAADHPRADYIKMRGLTAGFPALPKGILHEPALATFLAGHAARVAPLVKWTHALGA